ncbi:hypothetical protein BDY19DRAFT_299383 [Irpex rosettiformis]|uniref:Uncharacterized protein n=1 Tax=Irpex rosettiformis TaxID=378272 RepID=A0ACB8TYM0_9APHY|nr:hypothetical protein BDY19DRAFT_299383 [Irpex rosettiformis]
MSDARIPTPTTTVTVSQPFIDRIRDRIRPKEANVDEFFDDCVHWWHHHHPKVFPVDKPRDLMQAEREVLKHMPFKEDQLKKFPFFTPDREESLMKPPSVSFGWVITAEEIRALGEREDAIITLVREGGLPPEGQSELRVYSPEATCSEVIAKGMKALNLDDKYSPSSVFFRMQYILKDFDPSDDQTYFIEIYGNPVFLPGREHLIPPTEDVKRLQDWLGLTDREPGWWFSSAFFYWTTWSEFFYYHSGSYW